jgi:peptide/nickel transport system permease protein
MSNMDASVDKPGLWTSVQDFCGSPGVALCLGMLCVFVLGSVLASWISPQNPYDLGALDIMQGTLPPGSEGSSYHFWLGTDDQGRDILSGILYGLRVSLGVGAGAALIALIVGTVLGLVAASVGGRIDSLLMRAVDLQLSFPSILVALMIVGFLGKGVFNVMLALVVAEWAWFARTVRAAAMIEMRSPYMDAARALQLGWPRLIFRHLLPNCLGPVIVMATMQTARAISLEATLSFLGLGVPVTQPSLGLLIANGYAHMLSGHYWISLFPGIALLSLVLGLNLLGERIRSLFDHRVGAP